MAALFSFTQAQKKAAAPANDYMTLEEHAERIRNCQVVLAQTSQDLEAAKEALQKEREAFIDAVERRGLFDFDEGNME